MDIKIKYYLNKFPDIKDLTIKRSNIDGKRYVAHFTKNNKRRTVHFGSDSRSTFFDDNTLLNKRKAYQARASKIKNKEGKYTYNISGTPNSFSYYILW